MPEDAKVLPVVQPDLAWLAHQQGLDPGNLMLAHDIGLAHYWQARAAQEAEAALGHWQHTIANWAMVLDSDPFWRDWGQEQGDIFGWSISEQQISSVKKRLVHQLLDQTAHFEGSQPLDAKFHLAAAFTLERTAQRLLRLYGGLRLSAPAGVRLNCGPLLVEQLGVEDAVSDFFLAQPPRRQDSQASLETMLRPIKGQSGEPALGTAQAERDCMLAFSGLGLPMTCLWRGEAEMALALLAAQQCPDCHSELCSPSALGRPLERCREDCTRFTQLNPSYAVTSGGRDWYVRDAAELLAAAHIALAEQRVAASEIKEAVTHGRQALSASQGLGVQELLRYQLGQTPPELGRKAGASWRVRYGRCTAGEHERFRQQWDLEDPAVVCAEPAWCEAFQRETLGGGSCRSSPGLCVELTHEEVS